MFRVLVPGKKLSQEELSVKKTLILFCMVLVSAVAVAENAPAAGEVEAPQVKLAVQVSDPLIDALVQSWQPGFAEEAGNAVRNWVANGVRLVSLEEKQSNPSRAGACPAVTQCAGPNCLPGPCAIADTGMQGCTRGSIGMLCPAGQTIHVQSCNCRCVGPFCLVGCPASQKQTFNCQ